MLRPVLLTLLLAAAPAAAGDEPARDFERAYRSRRPADRLTAVRGLAGRENGTSARLLASRVLADETDDTIVLEAIQGLRRIPEGPGRDPLLEELREAEGEHRVRLLRALAPMVGKRILAALLERTRDEEPRVRTVALSGLVGRAGEAVRLAQVAALADPVWEVRAAALDGLRSGNDASSVAPLIDALGREEGRLLEDSVQTLRAITGTGIGADADLWRRWHQAHPSGRAARRRADPPPSICPLLGCPTGRTVYVLDLSRSMGDPLDLDVEIRRRLAGEGVLAVGDPVRRIDVARAMLRRSLAGLDSRARFDVIGMSVRPWAVHGALIAATPRNVQRTRDRLGRLSPTGPTDIHGALRLALESRPAKRRPCDGPIGAERIVLLSEGYPSGGAVRDRETIVAVVAEAFLERRVRVDTVGIGACDVDLLGALARTTGGKFTRVGR